MSAENLLRKIFKMLQKLAARHLFSSVCHLVWISLSVLLIVSSRPSIANGQVIHSAPVVVKAWQVSRIAQHRLGSYRVFRTRTDGTAEPIPFQIDELSPYQDYILPDGILPNGKESNGIFDNEDELAFMGEDVGIVKKPTKFVGKKPNILYELAVENGARKGAVYVGIYLSKPPPLSPRSYVKFNIQNAQIMTSRYRYSFDKENYLVVRGIDLVQDGKISKPLVNSSTFYLKADLKYFLTLEVNHTDINSKLEAYKAGPVRTIVRVSFTYSILNMDLELGMYTEVSFFSNSVVLPAVMFNPLDGAKSLNEGSGFYYGFAISDNPGNINVDSNLPEYDLKNVKSYLSGKKRVESRYWISMTSPDYMMYLEVSPSKQMRKTGNINMLYKENKKGPDIVNRSKNSAAPLGQSNVNLASYFDLSRFAEGQHTVGFRLFFENYLNKSKVEDFKDLRKWRYIAKRVRDF